MKRFWSKVGKQGPLPTPESIAVHPEIARQRCWLWTATIHKGGYGHFRLGKKVLSAHRVSWFLAHRTWPNPNALHKCDNRACVRLSHLFEGTYIDNCKDREAKGRGQKVLVGENHPAAKLTCMQVAKIRKLGEKGLPQRVIAKQFGMNQSTVWEILNYKIWRKLRK